MKEHKIIRNISTRLRQHLRRILFYGKAHYCPICISQIRKYLTYGIVPRSNARCPVCGSLERHRLVWLFFQKKTDFFNRLSKRMLHFAPEPFFESRFKCIDNLDYLSADLNDPRAMVKMSITNIQYPNNSFDVIYCSHVLEHIPDDHRAMQELNRVLKPNGWAVIMVPITTEKTFEDPSVTSPVERENLYGKSDHVRRYGMDFKDRLERAGFNVIAFSAADIAGAHELFRMGVPDCEKVFLCKKCQ